MEVGLMAAITLINDIWFQLTLILAIAVISHFIISKFKQPMVIGEIIIGIILGPTIIGFILGYFFFPGNVVLFFDVETIELLASIGAIVLLFIIGLECDVREIYTKKSIAIGLGGIIVPFILGYFVSVLLLPSTVTAGFPATAIFIGAALVATSIAITASVLAEMGLLDSKVAKAILGAAVIDDILGMIVLSIAAGMSGQSPAILGLSVDLSIYVVFLVLISSAFIVIGVFIGAKYFGKLVTYVQLKGDARRIKHAGFLAALAVTFLYAFISESIGISAIVGAFVAGTMFSGIALKKELNRGASYLGAMFIPIFFITLGLLVDFHELYSNLGDLGIYLTFGVILTLVAIISKVIGCGIPARLFKSSGRESFAIGVGMTPRLEVALVIALYGLSTGIIHSYIYSVIVLMGVLTALVTPPLLRIYLKKDIVDKREKQFDELDEQLRDKADEGPDDPKKGSFE
jgi:Kef-type K+ transport system membrane component KefB